MNKYYLLISDFQLVQEPTPNYTKMKTLNRPHLSFSGIAKRIFKLKYLTIPVLILLLFKQCSFKSCVPQDPINQAIAVLDDAINSLNNASADWQEIVNNAIKNLPAELQSTIGNEMTNLVNRGVAAAGVEAKCYTDFIAKRMQQGLQRIKAKLLGNELPPLEPQFCSVVPGAIDMALDPSRRNKLEFFGYDFDHATVSVVLDNNGVEQNITQFLDQPTHYHMTLNLGGSGVQVTPQSRRFILRWNGKDISSIAVLQKVPDVCETFYKNVDDKSTSFIPPHVGSGDTEFDGHGPNISCKVTLIQSSTQLNASIYMKAIETKSDWTEASGTKTINLYTAQSNETIVGVVGPTSDSFSYIDNDHDKDFYDGAGPVLRYEFMGDGEGNDAGIHTGVTVHFARIRLQMKQKGDCVPSVVIRELQADKAISEQTLNAIRSINPSILEKQDQQ